MTLRLTTLILCLLLLACTAAKDLPVTNDMAEAERLLPALSRLTTDERRLFAAYIDRHKANRDGLRVPEGMTVGKAIDEQRRSIATATEGKKN